MKIQCNVCERDEATLMCCEDEVVLCWSCDAKVHAANQFAKSHQRVPLNSSSSHMPKCDICQESSGFFFCLEDRALLCRKCDTAIHSTNHHKSSHQKFLLTGVKVGLGLHDPGPSSPSLNSSKIEEIKAHPPQVQAPSRACDYNDAMPISGSPAPFTEWTLEDFLGASTEFREDFKFNFPDNSYSKGISGKHEDSEGSAMFRSSGEDDISDCLGEVTVSFLTPRVSSPPTASGIFWPPMFQSPRDSNAFIQEARLSDLQMINRAMQSGNGNEIGKKKRRY